MANTNQVAQRQRKTESLYALLAGTAHLGGMTVPALAAALQITVASLHRRYIGYKPVADNLTRVKIGFAHHYALLEDKGSLQVWARAERRRRAKLAKEKARTRQRNREGRRERDRALIDRQTDEWLATQPAHIRKPAAETKFVKQGPASVFELGAWSR